MPYLPCQEPPKLSIAPDVRDHLDVEIISSVCQAGNEGAKYGPEDEESRNGCIRKPGRYHCVGG